MKVLNISHTHSLSLYLGICALAVCMIAFAPQTSMADRGGWADPPGGWTFVEEWQDIPQFEGDPDWNHNNGSDSYSGNAHTDLLGMEVTRIDVIEGAGDTEDGENPAEDATVFTLIDLGDPRSIEGIDDPSDRKQYFLAPLHEPGFDAFEELFPSGDPFAEGITFVTRYRIFPLSVDLLVGDDVVVPETLGPNDTLMNIPEASDRAHVGVGFVDPVIGDFRVIVGHGYFQPNSVQILVDTPPEIEEAEGDGAANAPIAEGISNTEFHSIWMTAQADPEDDLVINVRAWIDGGLEPVEGQINRLSNDLPNPESLQSNDEWAGFRELSINLGSAGTPRIGAFQYDYVAATVNGAFEPEPGSFSPGGGTPVQTWSIY